MAISTIQWTDYTFNPWIGCRKVAPECANCYAETLDRNRYSKTLAPGTKENPVSHWGSGPRHRTKTWGDPVKWNRFHICNQCGETVKITDAHVHISMSNQGFRRPRVFCASLADWLDDENVPIEWFADLLRLIHDTPNLDWLLLTKRPQNFNRRMEDAFRVVANDRNDPHFLNWISAWHVQDGCDEGEADQPPANVWIGVSQGADQAAALAIPARIHFLSCEPMLKPLDETHAARFNWIIFGGESGSKARPVNVEWIRDGVKFCRANGVAPFVKQMGAKLFGASHFVTSGWPTTTMLVDQPEGWRVVLQDKHGGDMGEWPEDLRVREFPKQ